MHLVLVVFGKCFDTIGNDGPWLKHTEASLTTSDHPIDTTAGAHLSEHEEVSECRHAEAERDTHDEEAHEVGAACSVLVGERPDGGDDPTGGRSGYSFDFREVPSERASAPACPTCPPSPGCRGP